MATPTIDILEVARKRLGSDVDVDFLRGALDRLLEVAFAELGIDYAGHLSRTTGTRWEEQHTFPYHGERVLMEAHLKLGRDFDPANCLRIHFEWDPVDECWVIGHVGEHLPNTKS